MKHCIILFGLVFFCQFSNAQYYYSDIDYEKIKHVDKRTAKLITPSYNAKLLTQRITQPYDTDLEKVRAIYVWITHNIAYDCKKLKNKKRKKKKKITCKTTIECEEKLERHINQQVTKALRKRMGICDDYARIFKKMCDISSIEAGYVAGKTKTKLYKVGKKPCGIGHAWNWARIDGNVYLFDPTWGSGSVDKKCTEFNYSFDDQYFMIPPEIMILTHYPDETEHQFLEQPLSKIQFGDPPLYKTGYKEVNVIDFQPFKGTIKQSQKEVVFKVKIEEEMEQIILYDEINNITFLKEGDYFVLKYSIPKQPKQEIQIKAFGKDGSYYPLFTYRLRRGI